MARCNRQFKYFTAYELGERPEGVDIEHRHEAPVIVTAGRFHAEAEACQQTA